MRILNASIIFCIINDFTTCESSKTSCVVQDELKYNSILTNFQIVTKSWYLANETLMLQLVAVVKI